MLHLARLYLHRFGKLLNTIYSEVPEDKICNWREKGGGAVSHRMNGEKKLLKKIKIKCPPKVQ